MRTPFLSLGPLPPPAGRQFTRLMPSDAYPIRAELRRLVFEALEGVAPCDG